MKKFIQVLALVLILLTIGMVALSATSCTAADNVNHNLSQAADNFEVVRKITVTRSNFIPQSQILM